jgi:hypothetical protein
MFFFFFFNELEERNMRFLTDMQIEHTTMTITKTGYDKGIMDAIASLRIYLKENGIHNYENQQQGSQHKKLVETYILTDTKEYKTQSSLYRPKTKKGDPRIWIYGLKDYIKPNDCFVIIAKDGKLYVINITVVDIERVCSTPFSPVGELINEMNSNIRYVSEELLAKLRKFHGQWIPSDIVADTAIGRKVEALLGIPMNSSSKPDYKGIELKSFRDKRPSVRKGLFTKAPKWEISEFKGSYEICAKYGYPDNVTYKSYRHTHKFQKPNSRSLCLNIEKQEAMLAIEEGFINDKGNYRTKNNVVRWRLSDIQDKLKEKHHDTFWIEVHPKMENGREWFKFVKTEYTRNPVMSQLNALIEQRQITVDMSICRNVDPNTGKRISKTNGDTYGFKITKKAAPILFPDSTIYEL